MKFPGKVGVKRIPAELFQLSAQVENLLDVIIHPGAGQVYGQD